MNRLKNYELFEGVRDQMTPKSEETVKKNFKKIFNEIKDMHILDKLDVLNNKNVLRYLDEKTSKELIVELLKTLKPTELRTTGEDNQFYLIDSKEGNAVFIFNKDTYRICKVPLFALREVVNVLNYLI